MSETPTDLNAEITLKEVGKVTFKYSFSKLLISVTASILGIFSTRLLGPTELGKLNVVTQVSSLLSILALFGMDVTLERFISGNNDFNFKSDFYSAALKIVISFLILVIIILWVTNKYLKLLPSEIDEIFPFFFLYCIIFLFYQLNLGMLRGLGKFNILPRIEFINDAPGRAISVVLLYVIGSSFKIVFFSTLFIQIIIFIIVLYILLPYIKLTAPLNIFTKKEIKFTGGVYFTLLISTASMSVDVLLLRYFMNDRDVGIYSGGTRFTSIMQGMLLLPLQPTLLHYFSRLTNEKNRYSLFYFSTKYLAVFIGVISLLLFGFSQPIVTFILGKGYLESINVLRVSSLYLFSISLATVWTPYLTSHNKPSLIGVFILIGLVINLGLDVILIPRWSYNGAAIASLISKFAIPFLMLIPLKLKYAQIKIFVYITLIFLTSVLIYYQITFYLAPVIFIGSLFIFRIITITEIDKVFKSLFH